MNEITLMKKDKSYFHALSAIDLYLPQHLYQVSEVRAMMPARNRFFKTAFNR